MAYQECFYGQGEEEGGGDLVSCLGMCSGVSGMFLQARGGRGGRPVCYSLASFPVVMYVQIACVVLTLHQE